MANKYVVFILEFFKELLWWAIAAVFAIVVMFPITRLVQYSMFWMNGLLLVLAFTYFRYVLLLNSLFILKKKWLRFLLFVANINFFVFVLRQEQRILTIYDSFALEELGKAHNKLGLDQVNILFRYFYNETTLTVVACLAFTAILSLRIIWSYWKTSYQRLNAGSEE